MFDLDKMTADELREMYESKMKEESITKYVIPQHPSADGYYRVNVKDPTKKTGRRTIAAKTVEELKEKLYKYEKGIYGQARKTFREVFELAENEKLTYRKSEADKESTRSTIKKDWYDFKRFFEGTIIEHKYIDDISKSDLENVMLMNCKRYDLTRDRFLAMRTVMSTTFRFAFEQFWIEDNAYLRTNPRKFKDMLVEPTPIDERIFTDIEIKKIHDELQRIHEKRPGQMSAWAVEFIMTVYFRSGEAPTIEWDDIYDNYISVHKEQIKTVKGEYIGVDHTKTRYNRKFPLTGKTRQLLEKIRRVHDAFYPDSPYLFPNADGTGSIRKKAVYDCLYRICKKCGIHLSAEAKKGLHSFRRVGVNRFMKNTHDPITESRIFGHSPTVAERHYLKEIDLDWAAKMLD